MWGLLPLLSNTSSVKCPAALNLPALICQLRRKWHRVAASSKRTLRFSLRFESSLNRISDRKKVEIPRGRIQQPYPLFSNLFQLTQTLTPIQHNTFAPWKEGKKYCACESLWNKCLQFGQIFGLAGMKCHSCVDGCWSFNLNSKHLILFHFISKIAITTNQEKWSYLISRTYLHKKWQF